jgi:hypothetical protein
LQVINQVATPINDDIAYLNITTPVRDALRGFTKSKPTTLQVDLSIVNGCSNALDWVKLDWLGPDLPRGVLAPGISKTALDVDWPSLSLAAITFVDDATRKPYSYSVPISFSSINEQIASRRCHKVTLRILSYEKAEATCD